MDKKLCPFHHPSLSFRNESSFHAAADAMLANQPLLDLGFFTPRHAQSQVAGFFGAHVAFSKDALLEICVAGMCTR